MGRKGLSISAFRNIWYLLCDAALACSGVDILSSVPGGLRKRIANYDITKITEGMYKQNLHVMLICLISIPAMFVDARRNNDAQDAMYAPTVK